MVERKKVRDVKAETSIMASGRTLQLADYGNGKAIYKVSPRLEWRYDSKSLGRSEGVSWGKIRLEDGDIYLICDGLKAGDKVQEGKEYVINAGKLVDLLRERHGIDYDPRIAKDSVSDVGSVKKEGEESMDVLFEDGSIDVSGSGLDDLLSEEEGSE
jgi:hypothetical protein